MTSARSGRWSTMASSRAISDGSTERISATGSVLVCRGSRPVGWQLGSSGLRRSWPTSQPPSTTQCSHGSTAPRWPSAFFGSGRHASDCSKRSRVFHRRSVTSTRSAGTSSRVEVTKATCRASCWIGRSSERGALGEELAPLVAATVIFDPTAHWECLPDLDDLAFNGYLDGLHDVGWRGDPR